MARDYLHDTGKYTVVQGVVSPVHDSYTKKVSVALNLYLVGGGGGDDQLGMPD